MGHNLSARPADFLREKLQTLADAPHYALAVSGGGDSMGALAVAADLAHRPDAPRFTVLTVDHGLRAEARDETAMVAQTCENLRLTHHILTADEALGDGDIQQKARLLRYRLMAAFCHAHNTPLITAHHRHDQAETVAMRLARGSGVDGLAGMAARQWLETPAGRLLVVRPFLDISPDCLAQARSNASLPHCDDPSNADRRFERVRWREKLPAMAEAGLSVRALLSLASDMGRLKQSRDDGLYTWLQAHGAWHDYGVLRLSRDAWRDLSMAWRERLMSLCVVYFGRHRHPPKRAASSGLVDRIEATESGAAVLGGVLVRWRKRELFLGREYAALAALPRFLGETRLWDGRFFVTTPPQHAAWLPQGHFVAPLGEAGLAHLKARQIGFDKAIPAAYHAVLPAIFAIDGDNEPVPVGLATESGMACVSFNEMCDTVFGRGQW